MRVLVTGAGGFIGSNLVRELINNPNFEFILGVDRMGVPSIPELVQSQKGEWLSINLDEVDEDWWATTVSMRNLDAVFYIESLENLNMYQADFATINMFEKSDMIFTSWLYGRPLVSTAVDLKVVYLSTDKVYYGDTFPNEYHKVSINTFDEPTLNETYAGAKALTESKLAQCPKLDLRIVRSFSIAGPGQTTDAPIPQIIQKALNNEDIIIYNNGIEGVAFTHVKDLTRFLQNANLFDPEVKASLQSNLINFCRVQNYVSVRQLAEKIINKTGSSSKIVSTMLETDDLFTEVQKTPQIRNLAKITQPIIPIEILLDEMIYELNPINSYAELVVTDINFDNDQGSVEIIGTVEPESTLTIWFGNGEMVIGSADTTGNFNISHTFEFAIDIYPIEIKATTKDSIQYTSKIIEAPL
jgi:nucleoside-diphosphate-sugar epimerase